MRDFIQAVVTFKALDQGQGGAGTPTGAMRAHQEKTFGAPVAAMIITGGQICQKRYRKAHARGQ